MMILTQVQADRDQKIQVPSLHVRKYLILGDFLKWWVSPTTIGFPTKNDHFGVEIGGTTIYRLFWGVGDSPDIGDSISILLT